MACLAFWLFANIGPEILPVSEGIIKQLLDILPESAILVLLGCFVALVIVRYSAKEIRESPKTADQGGDTSILARIIRLEGEVKYIRRDLDRYMDKEDK